MWGKLKFFYPGTAKHPQLPLQDMDCSSQVPQRRQASIKIIPGIRFCCQGGSSSIQRTEEHMENLGSLGGEPKITVPDQQETRYA